MPAQAPRDQATQIRVLVRWRLAFVIAAVVIPGLLFLLFNRQQRRLDRLAEEGVVATATVTKVTRGGVHYAYGYDGERYDWNVKRSEAPNQTNATFGILVSPHDPSLSRPTVDHDRVRTEVAHSRTFGGRVVAGFAIAIGLLAFATHRALGKARSGIAIENTPEAYRSRLRSAGMLLAVPILGITGFHASDAYEKGQSLVPVALGLLLVVGIIGGMFTYAGKHGPDRLQRAMRWIAPVGVALGLVRLIALWLGH